MVLSLGVREILQQVSGNSVTIDLLVDNKSALQLLQGRGANRTRHLRIRSNFVKERVEAREVSLHHIPGQRQEADLFTKVLPGPRLRFLRGLVGLQTSSEDQEYPVVQAASVPAVSRSVWPSLSLRTLRFRPTRVHFGAAQSTCRFVRLVVLSSEGRAQFSFGGATLTLAPRRSVERDLRLLTCFLAQVVRVGLQVPSLYNNLSR